MPHKLAEKNHPGTMDEKLNCEVATYAWIQENCPEFPFTHLIGFEFSDGAKVRIYFNFITMILSIEAVYPFRASAVSFALRKETTTMVLSSPQSSYAVDVYSP